MMYVLIICYLSDTVFPFDWSYSVRFMKIEVININESIQSIGDVIGMVLIPLYSLRNDEQCNKVYSLCNNTEQTGVTTTGDICLIATVIF